jgi:hypothetical protein
MNYYNLLKSWCGFAIVIVFSLVPFLSSAQDTAYFQQSVDYDIAVTLDDINHKLQGNIIIRYKNNSSTALPYIMMHIWPNAYKNRNTALSKQLLENGRKSLFFASDDERGYIEGLSFLVNDTPAKFVVDSEFIDTGTLFLAQPLQPGETAIISTPFTVKIPSGKFSRLGHIGTSYQVVQWFPKPAVFDNNGWHRMPYLDQGEFYSEFGSFKVAITVPQNYVIAATGVLQENSEREWLLKNVEETKSMQGFGKDNSFPASSTQMKTVTYLQDSIHDFAWFADKRFHVLRQDIQLPKSNRMVEGWVFFTNHEADLWKNAPAYLNDAIRYFSERVGDYPYSQFSAVDGTVSAGGGMEYPMATIINTSGDDFTLEDVLIHEIAHSWFYGILGFNERTEGWLDEGITSYYELEYIENKYRNNLKGKNDLGTGGYFGKITGMRDVTMKEGFDLTYKRAAFNNSDQPAATTSVVFSDLNYGAVMYRKTALAFDYLEDYLGTQLFDDCMQAFYEKYKYRHPQGRDVKRTFEIRSNKNLDWFFNGLIETNGAADYQVKKIKCNPGGCDLLVENKGTVPAPLKICNDKDSCNWIEGFNGKKEIHISNGNSNIITINKGYSTLLKSKFQQYSTSGICKKKHKYDLNFTPDFSEQQEKPNLNLLPIVAWNNYNKFMAGAAFTNITIIPKKFEYSFTPLYDFRNSDIAGVSLVDYNIWPMKGIFSEISPSVSAKRFAYAENRNAAGHLSDVKPVFNYTRLVPSIYFKFRKSNHRSPVTHSITFRDINIWLDEVQYEKAGEFYLKNYITTSLNFNELSYVLRNDKTLDPYGMKFKLEQGEKYLKASADLNFHFSYPKLRKGIDIRFFTGFFPINNEKFRNYNFRMSGWNGYNDYLFDELYFGRTETDGILSQQFLVREGGFKIPTFVGQSNKWIASMNIKVDVPYPLPVKFFFDIGTYDGISTVFPEIDNKVMYDGGLCISLGTDVLEIYFPFIKSKDIERNLEANNIKFREQIRFVFNLNKLSPLLIRNDLTN